MTIAFSAMVCHSMLGSKNTPQGDENGQNDRREKKLGQRILERHFER